MMPILSLLFLVVVIPWLNLVPQICFELGESELAILVAVAIPANDTFDVMLVKATNKQILFSC